jgi:hypothetical protein
VIKIETLKIRNKNKNNNKKNKEVQNIIDKGDKENNRKSINVN